MTEISGPRFGPASNGQVRQLIVLLHGWGADGNDLIELAPHWSGDLPDAAFVSPHAPFECDVGFGRQWFSLGDRTPEHMLAGVRAAAPILDKFLDTELKRLGLTDRQLALVGFSQGTMMSLYAAPRRALACACVLGYSGALVAGDALKQEARSKMPILLIHGAQDEMLPPQRMIDAAAKLRAASFDVATDIRPDLGHSIDLPGLQMGGAFLKKHLAA
ncbi:MAG: alpha/beta hydrolase [Alphaproteobacteria bacterium]